MKIIIDTRWIRSLNIDGIANFTLNITGELLNTDRKNTYVLLVGSPEIGEFLKQNISVDIEKYFIKVNYPVNSLKNLYLLPILINKLKPDIFFSPCYPFFSPVIKQKHIGVVHDLIPLIFPELFRKAGLKFRLFYCSRFFQKLSLKKLVKIIAVSNSTKNDLIRLLGQNKEKISVIVEGSRGVSEKSFFTKNMRHKPNVFLGNALKPFLFGQPPLTVAPPPDDFGNEYFLFVGRHEIYKNIITLINVYHQLPESIKIKHKLVIVGKYNELHSHELLSKVKELHEEDKIYFLDSIMPERLSAIYSKAKLLIHLSLYEGFGLTIAEAMAFGIPVIASNRSSIPEVVGDAGILVNPENYPQIIESIIKIVEDKVLYKTLSEKGLARVKYFTWQKSAEQLMEIFHEYSEQNFK